MKESQKLTFFCISTPGLESLLLNELRLLRLRGLTEKGGATVTGGYRDLFEANLRLRTPSRILLRISEFHAASFPVFEKRVRRIDWSGYLKPGTRIDLGVTSSTSKLYHEAAIAERFVKWLTEDVGVNADDLAEAAAEGHGNSVQKIFVRIVNNRCSISIDTSGEHLHRRGYRLESAKAPLRENLAAACVLASGWAKSRPALYDPFCGSGTLLIEAALLARRIAPGLVTDRSYAFMNWPCFDDHRELWNQIRDEARQMIIERPELRLLGSDRDAGAIAAAAANAGRAGIANSIEWTMAAFSSVDYSPGSFLLTNPPFGLRVGDDLRDIYAAFGNRLIARPDLRAAWLCSNPSWAKATGISWKPSLSFSTGGISVRLLTRQAGQDLDGV